MHIEHPVPNVPTLVEEGRRRYVQVPWDGAEALRSALAKHGCPTTLCLDPENREARLELWPDVSGEAVRAVLEARRAEGRPGSTTAPATARDRLPTTVAEPVDLICI